MPNSTVRAVAIGLPFETRADRVATRIGEALHLVASALAAVSVIVGVTVLCLVVGG